MASTVGLVRRGCGRIIIIAALVREESLALLTLRSPLRNVANEVSINCVIDDYYRVVRILCTVATLNYVLRRVL